MKVENMVNSNGNRVPNQFVITDEGRGALGNFKLREVFQSFSSIIAEKIEWDESIEITLDAFYWDYSTATGKYRNIFLGEKKAETQKKIDSGEYKLADLN